MRSNKLLSLAGLSALVALMGCYVAMNREPVDRSALPLIDPVAESLGDAPPIARFVPELRPETDDGPFPERIELDGEPLVLNGAGLCEWGVFGIDLYRAALYTAETCSDLDAVLASSPRTALHLQFVRSLTQDQLGQAYTASVKANTGDDAPRYDAALAALRETMVSVDAGDSLTFVVQLGDGVEVFANGAARGTVADPDFARLFLRLYLGDKPPTRDLKRALLGDS